MSASDLLLEHGTVITLDRASRTAEAVAIRQGKIVDVESSAALARHVGPETRRIDLGGGSVVPGGESPNSRLVDQLGLRDYLAERFAIAGTPDECVEKIQRLAAIGVNQIWTSPSFADKMAFMRAWSEQVLPHVG